MTEALHNTTKTLHGSEFKHRNVRLTQSKGWRGRGRNGEGDGEGMERFPFFSA